MVDKKAYGRNQKNATGSLCKVDAAMKLHPFDECLQRALELRERGVDVYQQFNCAHCGRKQTMELANAFFEQGVCDECHTVTDIASNGCNYAVHFKIGCKA